MSEVRYMISDAADKLGMEAHVLRYWEEELELEVPRNEMGHRYYTEEWLCTFNQIRLLKQKGYQLKAIKMLIHNENQCQPEQFVMDLENALLSFDGLNAGESKLMKVPPSVAGTSAAGLKMEQFQTLMTDIVKNALAENNQQLGQAVSEQVGEKVIKEMNYLMREREEQEEERFRKLDATLRSRQKKVKDKKEGSFWKRKKKEGQEAVPQVILTPKEET